MGIYSQFKTVDNAILIKFKANDDGSVPCFKIGRQVNTNVLWAKTLEAKTRPFKQELEDKSISEVDARSINVDVFVTAILQGWENIQDENGSNIEYNYANAIKLFMDLPDLFSTLNFKSMEMGNFLASNLKSNEKN